ncbi:hypothetical protein Mapa_012354 [Marchantia paleacea]|nr:hypothetical protein Mapa_012354 [Marchantia paleacea]
MATAAVGKPQQPSNNFHSPFLRAIFYSFSTIVHFLRFFQLYSSKLCLVDERQSWAFKSLVHLRCHHSPSFSTPGDAELRVLTIESLRCES